MISLTNASKGRYIVLTETAEYLLDLNSRTAVRTLRSHQDHVSSDIPAAQVRLEDDGQEFHIASLDPVIVGYPMMIFMTDPNAAMATARRTTTVRDIISLNTETELLND